VNAAIKDALTWCGVISGAAAIVVLVVAGLIWIMRVALGAIR
jgi:heme/copper-type cytochrome/quinol oxidase subunit 4